MSSNAYRRTRVNTRYAYILLLPVILGLSVFALYPVLYTFYLSFLDWYGLFEPQFIGWGNYRHILQDTTLGLAVFNTLRIAIIAVPVGIFISLSLAIFLNKKIKGVQVLRVLYYLPVVTMVAASVVIWKQMFNYNYGFINYILVNLLGLEKVGWLTDPQFTWITLTIFTIWGSLGSHIILQLAALQTVSKELYECAELEGANAFQRFVSITIPSISPVLFFQFITGFVGGFQIFQTVALLFTENSKGILSVKSMVYVFYESAFIENQNGLGATYAVFIFSIIMLFTGLQFIAKRYWVYEGGE